MATHFERPLNMKGMCMAQTKRNLIIAVTLAGAAAMFQKWRGWNHKAKSKEFYENYDIYCDFHEMAEKGLFQSCL